MLRFSALAACTLMAACGGSGGSNSGQPSAIDPVMTAPGRDPIDPTITTLDVTSFENTFAIVDDYTPPPIFGGPQVVVGKMSYDGQMEVRMALSEQSGQAPLTFPVQRMIGDLDVELDFRYVSGEDNFTGSASNFNLIEDGVPVERVDGTLTITGAFNAGQNGRFRTLRTNARGNLTATFGREEMNEIDVSFGLNGITRDAPSAPFGAISGSVNGFATRDLSGSQFQGEFYLLEESVARP